MTATAIYETATEVHRAEWSERRGPMYGTPAGTDYYTAIYTRKTWPQDGSVYAGITYETKWVWIGNGPGRRNVVVHHSDYPASRSPLKA